MEQKSKDFPLTQFGCAWVRFLQSAEFAPEVVSVHSQTAAVWQRKRRGSEPAAPQGILICIF